MKNLLYKFLFLPIIFFVTVSVGFTQELGLSFSYFLPENGNFSVPVSPLSFRDVGIDFTNHLSLESGITLYLIPGMGIKDVPFSADEPIMGPMLSLFVPAELVFQFFISNQVIRIKGGGFLFYNLFNGLREGNLDKAIRAFEHWQVANTAFTYDNRLGRGLHAGFNYIIYISEKAGITLGANYLKGFSDINLRGTYAGGSNTTGIIEKQAAYPKSKLNYSGLEVSVGLLFSN